MFETILKELQEEKIELDQHVSDKEHQRNKFNEQIQNLKDGEAVLAIDFKQNPKIGKTAEEGPSLIEIGKAFYSKKQVTVLGVVIITNKEVHHVDILSNDLKHDASFVMGALDMLFAHDIWKSSFSHIKHAIFWHDGGPHFRALE